MTIIILKSHTKGKVIQFHIYIKP